MRIPAFGALSGRMEFLPVLEDKPAGQALGRFNHEPIRRSHASSNVFQVGRQFLHGKMCLGRQLLKGICPLGQQFDNILTMCGHLDYFILPFSHIEVNHITRCKQYHTQCHGPSDTVYFQIPQIRQ